MTLNKYYVITGNHRILLLAKSPLDAASIVIKKVSKPGNLINVSEVGFDLEDEYSSPNHKLDKTYKTSMIKKSGK